MSLNRASAAVLALLAVLAAASGGVGAAPLAATDADTPAQVETADASTPQVSVAVAGKPVPDGGSITTSDDPTLSIRAEGQSPIEVVSVRIDGETRRTFVPNATIFEETARPDLAAGSRTLKVVVETNDSTTTYTATIVEDSVPPLMTFDSPFTTGGENASIYESPNASYTLNRSRVRLEGELHDHSAVEKAVIETRYRSDVDAEWGSRNRTVIEDPGSSISQVVRFGPSEHTFGEGENELQVTLTDSFGQTRRYEVDIRVDDTDRPTVEIVNQTAVQARSAIRVRARVVDQVGLRSVGYRIGPADGEGLKHTLSTKPPANRPLNHTFTAVVPVSDGTGNITIVAADGTGNATTREITVNRTELVTPRIRLSANLAGGTDAQRLRVDGRVYDGQITGVTVETIDPDDSVTDLNRVYGGAITDSVTIGTTLRVDDYPTRVRVRAMDSSGEEHIRTIQLSPNGSTSTEVTPFPETESTDDTVRRTPLPGSPAGASGLFGSLLELFGVRQVAGGVGGVAAGGYILRRVRG